MLSKKVKISMVILSLGWCQTSFSAPKSMKVFTTLDKASEIIDLQKSDYPNTEMDVYFIDRKQDIIKSMNSHIPTEKFERWDEDQRFAWGQRYLKDIAPQKTLKIMKSTLGVSYMQLFDIQRVPAVLMDNDLITYGMTMTESITSYDKHKAEEYEF